MSTNNEYITLQCPQCGRQKEVLSYRGAKHFACCTDWVVLVQGVEQDNFMLKPGYKSQYRKLVMHELRPPIPVRHYDWTAYLDGDDENPHLRGFGETPRDALLDLLVVQEDLLNEEGDLLSLRQEQA